ncbi:MAG: hypothetical protein GXP25_01485 [Planctomycetes bacterium]|nr:hypothetical protein [Planctomycetota bacterium]
MAQTFADFDGQWGANARLAWDTLALRPTRGVPNQAMNLMVIPLIEEIGRAAPGEYEKDPERVYRDFQLRGGACALDQWIPTNPLTMTARGFGAHTQRRATTGAKRIVVDDMAIDSPEAVVEHMERFLFPRLEKQIAAIDPADDKAAARLVRQEIEVQEFFGMDMLKIPYKGFKSFPMLLYSTYGYANYFMAYALYPDMMARCFHLQGDLAERSNAIAARAIIKGGLPRLIRLDHDMCDSRGTLVDVRTLDSLWFPHFARCIRPFLEANIRLIWHCDGNVMDMVPRLIDAGISGFQGFQYEDGVDYPAICRMTDRNGDPLMIWAGVSVTTTLPHGTTDDVVNELKWLVEHGPAVGLFLGASSSIAPATNPANVKGLIKWLNHYREHGRG